MTITEMEQALELAWQDNKELRAQVDRLMEQLEEATAQTGKSMTLILEAYL